MSSVLQTLGKKARGAFPSLTIALRNFLFETGVIRVFPGSLSRLVLSAHSVDRDRSSSSNCVAILGRGPSLKHVHELEFVDQCILLNDFDSDLLDETVRGAVEEKRIIHMTNIEEFTLSTWNLLRLDVERYQLRTMAPDGSDRWWRAPRKWPLPEAKGMTPEYLPERLEPLLEEHFPDKDSITSLGIIAILYAAESDAWDHVYTVGIDFFEDGEYLTQNLSPEMERHQKSKTEGMKRQLVQIAELFDDVQFHVITKSSFDPVQPNIHVYHRNVENNCS